MNVVDLNNTFKYDKIVINLNNHNCLQVNTAESCFYVNLVEPIKNIIYIKILKEYLESSDTTKIKKFVRVMNKLDELRNTNWRQTIPDVYDLLKRHCEIE